MPEKLRCFLQLLSVEEADAMWAWLDGDPAATYDMIKLVAEKVGGEEIPGRVSRG